MGMMQAWRSHQAGGPSELRLEEVRIPEPDPNEVLIKVRAVGVNFPDGLLIRDLYQIKPPRPLVPGSEFCGVVEDTGANVTRLKRGETVAGASGWGAMSQYITLHEQRLFRVPDGIPTREAAAFLFTYATAYHALRDVGRLRSAETLFVLGAAGGVGSAAVAVGKALGATVIAGVSTQPKLEFALRAGSTSGLIYPASLEAGVGQREFARQLKLLAPGGLDVVLDPVGGAYSEPAMRSLSCGGRHLVVGFTAGIPVVPLNIALLRSCHISGVDWRTFIEKEPARNERNLEALFDMWQSRQIEPTVAEVYPFHAAPEAIARLEGREAMGKIVVTL